MPGSPETGALSEAEIDALLDGQHGPAEQRPMPLPGLQGVGNSPTLAREEHARRYRAMGTMLANGFGTREIVEFFGRVGPHPDTGEPGFAMGEDAVRHLIQAVLNSWQEEDALLAPHKKRIAIRRNLAHIRAARARNAFTAVASLEANLMKLEGTAAPVRVEHEHRVTGAILGVLGDMSEEELRNLVSGEAARTDRVALPPDAGAERVPVGETRVSQPQPRR